MEFLDHLRRQAYGDTSQLATAGLMSPGFDFVFEDHLLQQYSKRRRPLVIVDLGSWKGLSAITMASIAKRNNVPVTIVCVDTWLGAPELWTEGLNDRLVCLECKDGYPQVYHTFLRNVLGANHQDTIVPFPIPTTQAMDVLSHHGVRADMVCVHATREYEQCRVDIRGSWELLSPGGFLFGNDYDHERAPGVVRAVNEFLDERGRLGKSLHGVWFVSQDA